MVPNIFQKNELVDYLQKVGVKFGADLNAYTGFDETVYILPISTQDPKVVEQGFTVLEDWAGNNLLDTSEINKERGVVLEESRLNKGAQQRMLKQYLLHHQTDHRFQKRLLPDECRFLVEILLKHYKFAEFFVQMVNPFV